MTHDIEATLEWLHVNVGIKNTAQKNSLSEPEERDLHEQQEEQRDPQIIRARRIRERRLVVASGPVSVERRPPGRAPTRLCLARGFWGGGLAQRDLGLYPRHERARKGQVKQRLDADGEDDEERAECEDDREQLGVCAGVRGACQQRVDERKRWNGLVKTRLKSRERNQHTQDRPATDLVQEGQA